MSSIDGKTIAIAALVIAIAAIGYNLITPGSQGPEGPQGVQGLQGETGPQGPAGEGVDVAELNALIEETLGEELAERLQIPIESSIDPRRGCTSCHVLIDPEVGKYTLAYEAHERVEARRGTDSHPSIAPDGTDLSPTSDAGVETCLLCHAPDPDTGRGVMAPLFLSGTSCIRRARLPTRGAELPPKRKSSILRFPDLPVHPEVLLVQQFLVRPATPEARLLPVAQRDPVAPPTPG